jgi:hypothetical protein
MRMVALGIILVATLITEQVPALSQTVPAQQPTTQQPTQQPTTQQPTTPAPPGSPAVPAPVVPPAQLAARTFTAPTGMVFHAVRAERVVDFETVVGYLQSALEKSADPQVRAQAKGWRVFKATEPGPNGTVLYAFLLDPAVPAADYALGPILSDAYPDQIERIWKLYQGALAGPGSQTLLNLTPVQPPPLPTPGTAPTATQPPDTRPAQPSTPPAQPGTPQ